MCCNIDSYTHEINLLPMYDTDESVQLHIFGSI